MMNGITWTLFWIISSQLVFVEKTIATPLMKSTGRKLGGNNVQTINGIRFSNDNYDTLQFDPTRDVRRCARGATFCERIENYPSDEFQLILSEENKYAELFGSDLVVNTITIGSRFGDDDIQFPEETLSSRFGGDEDEEEQLCPSHVRLIYPQAGLTRDNTWRYIVNQSNYTQGVRVDECIHKRQCHMMQHLPFGFTSQCKQKYVYRQLVSIDEDGNTTKDLFKIPSCCQCVLIRNRRY